MTWTTVARIRDRVVAAARGMCTCEGRCGLDRHPVSGPRCHQPAQIAAPDRWLPDHQAAAVPETDLTAWCPACWDRARRTAAKARREATPEPDSLF